MKSLKQTVSFEETLNSFMCKWTTYDVCSVIYKTMYIFEFNQQISLTLIKVPMKRKLSLSCLKELLN